MCVKRECECRCEAGVSNQLGGTGPWSSGRIRQVGVSKSKASCCGFTRLAEEYFVGTLVVTLN